jgi:hypothetical protein
MPKSPPPAPPANTKAKGFKIGGKAKKPESPAPLSPPEGSQSLDNAGEIPTRHKNKDGPTTRPAKKGFKIGGRSKTPTMNDLTDSQETEVQKVIPKPTPAVPVESPVSGTVKADENVLAAEEREETEEEKVERKRRELKRKNEELAKKQAQSKKKKRF